MPYGNSARFVRAYAYGCRQPITGLDEALAEMRRRNDFWNTLVALERDHQAARLQLLRDACPGWDDADKAGRKTVYADPLVKAALDQLEAERRAAVLAAKHASGLWWANADDVLLSYEQARKRPGDLRFHAWRTLGGKLQVRWQAGVPAERLLGATDSRLQIDARTQLRTERARDTHRTLRFCVRTDERRPVWVTLPLVLDRPLPAGAIVRQATLVRERLTVRTWRWQVVIVLEVPAPTPATGPVVGIDLGWRQTEQGIRVAVWRGSDGASGEVVLPASDVAMLRREHALRGVRDDHFNAIRAELRAWLAATETPLPDELRAALAHLAQWRGPTRLRLLAERWADARFAGDEAIYPRLHAWAARERHLRDWQDHERDQTWRRRREGYRRVAAELTGRYGTVVIERFDLRAFARQQANEHPADHANRALRTLAAPSVFRLAVQSAARSRGVTVTLAPAKDTTRRCYACGHLNTGTDFAGAIIVTCAGCGQPYDQDDNAARWLLAVGTGREGADSNTCADRQ